VKPLGRPVRISMIIGLARKFPAEEAAHMACDELKGTLMEMGIGVRKVATIEDVTLEGMRKAKGMTDQEAFDFFSEGFKLHLAKLGVSRSVIRDLRFE